MQTDRDLIAEKTFTEIDNAISTSIIHLGASEENADYKGLVTDIRKTFQEKWSDIKKSRGISS